MKYIVRKGEFIIEITKEKDSIIVAVDYDMIKEYYTLVKNAVFKLIGGKWKMLNTDSLKYEKELLKYEKGVLDLTQVITMYPVEGEYLKLRREEIYFLQALIYDLLIGKNLDWLPVGTDYTFENGHLKSVYDSYEYEYPFPSKDLSHPIF